jgi:hypothetical protein
MTTIFRSARHPHTIPPPKRCGRVTPQGSFPPVDSWGVKLSGARHSSSAIVRLGSMPSAYRSLVLLESKAMALISTYTPLAATQPRSPARSKRAATALAS